MKKLLFTVALLASCGTDNTSDLDIVGGQRAPYKSWYGFTGGCGSTLIAPRWAISAAHCGNPKQVTFGLYKKGDPNNGGKPKETIGVKRVVKHPKWDLALLELKRPSKFKPIHFYGDAYLEDKARLAVFGFGNAEYQGSGPEYLQGAIFKFNKRATQGARESIIRAENRTKSAVCHGDSGGPVIYQNGLVATVTFTEGKCSIYGLMGFTKIDIEWVKRYVKEY